VLEILLDPETDARLSELASETGMSKSHFVREALSAYLEDRADYLLAVAELEKGEAAVSLEQVRRDIGI